MSAYWRAANYLTIGQIYLQSNPLLLEPLESRHIKPRLLGHWGTSPGLSFLYIHINRLIRQLDLNAIFLTGPGHGGPALIAQTYLEGTYSEIYPNIGRDLQGILALFRQFSTPGGVPSHASPNVPGSIHEGGELGYVLCHAFGAVLDNPSLLAVAVVGDGEAETGPLEGSWKGISFLNPRHDGAVLPILHLNGYKISGPTVLGRKTDAQIRELFQGHGYTVYFVEGDEANVVHKQLAEALDAAISGIRAIQSLHRQGDSSPVITETPCWPLIIFRTPKGWTGPKEVDGMPVEGTFRAHQVPLAEVHENPKHLALLEQWLRSYEPEKLFNPTTGEFLPSLAALAPKGDRRMSANPWTNAGLISRPLNLPDFRQFAVPVKQPGRDKKSSTEVLGLFLRDIYKQNPTSFRLFCPDETNSNRLGHVFEVENRCHVGPCLVIDDHVTPNGRVMEVLSEHLCEGWLEGYTLTGRYGLFASYEAFTLIVASMVGQHAKWLEVTASEPQLDWRKPIPSLNILLTSTCWRNDHNGFSHQGPGFMDTLLTKKGLVTRIYLPPDANSLLAVANHCLASKNYVNLIIIDKQLELQYLSMEEAIEHARVGASIWKFASNDHLLGLPPAVVFACAGDIATMETLAAVDFLRQELPQLPVRVVNVVDLMRLSTPQLHPHGLPKEKFIELFTEASDVIFAYHGYHSAVHSLIHNQPNAARFHVKGYMESGTTTTPFDMVVLNQTSRYHLVMEAIKRITEQKNFKFPAENSAESLVHKCEQVLADHVKYTRTQFDDLPFIKNWAWPQPSANANQGHKANATAKSSTSTSA